MAAGSFKQKKKSQKFSQNLQPKNVKNFKN